MRLGYTLYVLLLFLLFLSSLTYLRLGSLEERIGREEAKLEELLRNVRVKEGKLEELKRKVSKLGLERYGDMEALEIMLDQVERLREEFDVEILKDATKDGNLWKMDLKLSFRPESGKDLGSKIDELLNSKAPVVFLRKLHLNTEEGVVEILISLQQPFVEEGA